MRLFQKALLSSIGPKKISQFIDKSYSSIVPTVFAHEHGIVIGRCMPPHVGHVALARFAAAQCKKVTFLVEQRPDEIIPVDTRAAWLSEAIQNSRVEVKPLLGDHPQAPPKEIADQPEFWRYWNQLLRSYVPNVNAIFSGAVISGDDYGKRLATDFKVPWIPFDRNILPISATQIRENPWKNWSWISSPAQKALTRRLILIGPEGSGKSTLAPLLAKLSFPSALVIPEYAASWIKRTQGKMSEEALHAFLNGQLASRHAWLAHANRWMVEDSHPIMTAVRARQLGMKSADEFMALAEADRPHHVLLLSPEGLEASSESAEQRMFFFEMIQAQLDAWNWPYTVLKGDFNTRLLQGKMVTEELLKKWQSSPLSEWIQEDNLKVENHIRSGLRKVA